MARDLRTTPFARLINSILNAKFGKIWLFRYVIVAVVVVVADVVVADVVVVVVVADVVDLVFVVAAAVSVVDLAPMVFFLFLIFIIILLVQVDVMESIDNSYYHVKHILGAGRANAKKASF